MLSTVPITATPMIPSAIAAPVRSVKARPIATGTQTIAVPTAGITENISVSMPSASAEGTPRTRYVIVATIDWISPAPTTPHAIPRPVSTNAAANRSRLAGASGACCSTHAYQPFPSTRTP